MARKRENLSLPNFHPAPTLKDSRNVSQSLVINRSESSKPDKSEVVSPPLSSNTSCTSSLHDCTSTDLVVNKLLTEEDAREILEKLIPAQNESYMLGITLNLPVSQVNSIQYEFRDSKQRLLQTIIAFLRQESKPTWSVIVAALRSPVVNHQALANRVEKAHVHEPRDTCAPLETSGE